MSDIPILISTDFVEDLLTPFKTDRHNSAFSLATHSQQLTDKSEAKSFLERLQHFKYSFIQLGQYYRCVISWNSFLEQPQPSRRFGRLESLANDVLLVIPDIDLKTDELCEFASSQIVLPQELALEVKYHYFQLF